MAKRGRPKGSKKGDKGFTRNEADARYIRKSWLAAIGWLAVPAALAYTIFSGLHEITLAQKALMFLATTVLLFGLWAFFDELE